jgi:acetylornithine aminotransferase
VPPLTIQPRHIREAIARLERALLACQRPTPSAT